MNDEKKFELPKAIIVKFDDNDVIATSGPLDDAEGQDWIGSRPPLQ